MNANIPTLYPTHKSVINCNATGRKKTRTKQEETIKIICSFSCSEIRARKMINLIIIKNVMNKFTHTKSDLMDFSTFQPNFHSLFSSFPHFPQAKSMLFNYDWFIWSPSKISDNKLKKIFLWSSHFCAAIFFCVRAIKTAKHPLHEIWRKNFYYNEPTFSHIHYMFRKISFFSASFK